MDSKIILKDDDWEDDDLGDDNDEDFWDDETYN